MFEICRGCEFEPHLGKFLFFYFFFQTKIKEKNNNFMKVKAKSAGRGIKEEIFTEFVWLYKKSYEKTEKTK